MKLARTLTCKVRSWPIAGSFRIARGAKTLAKVVEVTLRNANGQIGHGECVPYARYGESTNSVISRINAVKSAIEAGAQPTELQGLLPAGAARNAVECALWDLRAQEEGKPVYQLVGRCPFQEVNTAITISLGSPANMAKAASAIQHASLLKVKLAGDKLDTERVAAITQSRADAKLILDGNEGFTLQSLNWLLGQLQPKNIAAIEQPLPQDKDDALETLGTPIPVCADESLHTRDDLHALARKYDMVNIKLDKTGGLGEALALYRAARAQGMQIMVGCMVASSLSMAPALLLARNAELVDLDGPLLLAKDHDHGLQYSGSTIKDDAKLLWGYPREGG